VNVTDYWVNLYGSIDRCWRRVSVLARVHHLPFLAK
jgi:hypothetical protein